MKRIVVSSIVSLLSLSCSVSAPDNSSPLSGRMQYAPTGHPSLNFSDLEKEYKSFSTKALSDTYVRRMFGKYLTESPNPTQVIRQLEFARYLKNNSDTSYFDSLKTIIANENSIYTKIIAFTEVTQKMTTESGTFGTFVQSISPLPGVPVATSATAITAASFTANWHSVANATGYKLYINGSLAYTGTALSFDKTGLTSGSSHTYYVQATNSGGTSSDSNTIDVNTVFPVPGSLSTNGITDSGFTANWGAVTGATSYDVIVDFLSAVNVPSGTSYVVTGLASETSHTWKVRANKNLFNSAYTSDQNVTTSQSIPSNVILVNANVTGGLKNGSNWSNAYDSLQAALTAAVSGKDIWVASGTYKPTTSITSRTASFALKSGVNIYGGFAGNETSLNQRNFNTNIVILSGDINNDDSEIRPTSSTLLKTDNSYHVVTGSNNSTLDGVTVKFGYAGAANGQNDSYGGGMYNYNSSPTVKNVTFSYNFSYGGGGLYTGNVSSIATVTNVTFYNNTASIGGGMLNNAYSSSILTNVSFYNNNATIYGGGMCNYSYTSSTLTNVTFYNNTATTRGGGMYNFGSSTTVKNSIFWLSPIYNDTDSTLKIGYSDVKDGFSAITGPGAKQNLDGITIDAAGYTAAGNISADPLFVNTSDLDGADNIIRTSDDGFALQSSSPARNTGTTSAAPADKDIADITRPKGTAFDMGAYEFVE